MTPRTRSLLLLHGIVVIFGFTGILGKLISIDAEPLVFWRVTIGGLSTGLFLLVMRRWERWSWKACLRAGGVGWIVAAHWVTFFASIKASSVGLALTMLATAPLFVGLIEPLVFRRRVAWRELAVAAVVFVGISLVFQAEKDQILGITLGLTSAVLAAIFSTLNGVLVKSHDPVNLSAVELLAASVGMALWLAIAGPMERGPRVALCLGLVVDWVVGRGGHLVRLHGVHSGASAIDAVRVRHGHQPRAHLRHRLGVRLVWGALLVRFLPGRGACDWGRIRRHSPQSAST